MAPPEAPVSGYMFGKGGFSAQTTTTVTIAAVGIQLKMQFECVCKEAGTLAAGLCLKSAYLATCKHVCITYSWSHWLQDFILLIW